MLLSIVIGVMLSFHFVGRQRRLPHPLIDLELFRGRAFNVALTGNLVGTFAIYGAFFFTSQYLQLVLGLSPLEAGLWGLPGVGAMMIAAGGVVPRLAQRFRPGYCGLTIAALGCVLLAILDAGNGLKLVVPALVLVSLGMAPSANLVVRAAPPERSGSASGPAQAGNELAGALGIALLGTLGTALYRSEMENLAIPGVAEAARSTLGGATSVADQLSAATLDAAQVAFAQGLNLAAAACTVLLAAAAVLSAVMLRHVPAGSVQAGPVADDNAQPVSAGVG